MLIFATKGANPESAESLGTLSVGELLFSFVQEMFVVVVADAGGIIYLYFRKHRRIFSKRFYEVKECIGG